MVKKKKSPWFVERVGHKDGWSFVPMNWKGWVALVLLIFVNVFAANYFQLNNLVFDNWAKMGVVFCLSILVFVLIARKKTGAGASRGVRGSVVGSRKKGKGRR